jgi:phosphatidylinositol-3-phosphatase
MFRPLTIGFFILGTAAVLLRSPAPPAATRARTTLPNAIGILAAGLPRPDHTVVVIMENHSYSDIIGNPSAPYINSLRAAGASFTNSNAIARPSEPNYLALFAGTTEGLSDDSCPHTYSSSNLASGLAAVGLTFSGYSESMPANGYTGCESGEYARRHNPWVNFTNVSPAVNLTFTAFPKDYTLLPKVAFVIPNICNDMHDCSVATGDDWLRRNIDPYVRWATSHYSLFILTFDEGNPSTNQIPTIFVGPMVLPGDKGIRIDHYSVLRTLEDLYGIPPTGNAASASSIVSAFPTPTPTWTPVPRMPISPLHRTRGPVVVPFRAVLRPYATPACWDAGRIGANIDAERVAGSFLQSADPARATR